MTLYVSSIFKFKSHKKRGYYVLCHEVLYSILFEKNPKSILFEFMILIAKELSVFIVDSTMLSRIQSESNAL